MIEPKKTIRPAKFGNRGVWQDEADHMRAHPGDTFIIERRPHPNKAAYALAAHVRSGGYVAFRPAGSFNAWVEREGGNVEVIAVYVGEGTQAQEDGQTVASTPALAEETADSDGSEVVWTLVGGSKRNPVHAATILGQDVLHQKGYLWVADGEAAKMTIRPASFEDVRQNAVAYVENYLARKAEAGQDSGGKADDDVDLYALSEDELRSHLESLATPELHKIMESMGMSPFFANRIEAIGVIEMTVHNSKAAAASTPAPVSAPDSGSEADSTAAPAEDPKPARKPRTVQVRAIDPEPDPETVTPPEPAYPIGSVLYSNRGPLEVSKVTAKSVFLNGFRVSRAELEAHGRVWHGSLGWVDPKPRVVGGMGLVDPVAL